MLLTGFKRLKLKILFDLIIGFQEPGLDISAGIEYHLHDILHFGDLTFLLGGFGEER